MLLIPGWEHLKFSSLLKPCKKLWNISEPKYAEFWSATNVLQRLSQIPLDWSSIKQVRGRLIMSLRLLHLYRSIDLERTYRSLSLQEGAVYILSRRKGMRSRAWEKMIALVPLQELTAETWNLSSTGISCVCPTALLFQYVQLTAGQIPRGGALFCALTPPTDL